MLIIHDGNWRDHLDPPAGMSTGLDLSRRPNVGGYAYAGVATPFPGSLLIQKSDVQAIVAERKARRTNLRELALSRNLPCKDQNGTNYCWINAGTHTVEVARLKQNEPIVLLSPASAGGPITGFSNVGGWGKEGLQWIQEHGLVPVDKWPANAISSSYYTEENKKIALNYRQTEWWELEPGNMQQLWSCLLNDVPVAIGLGWWSHEVTYYDVDWIDGDVAYIFRNSWGMSYGDKGFGVLQGGKAVPDDAVAPAVAIAA